MLDVCNGVGGHWVQPIRRSHSLRVTNPYIADDLLGYMWWENLGIGLDAILGCMCWKNMHILIILKKLDADGGTDGLLGSMHWEYVHILIILKRMLLVEGIL